MSRPYRFVTKSLWICPLLVTACTIPTDDALNKADKSASQGNTSTLEQPSSEKGPENPSNTAETTTQETTQDDSDESTTTSPESTTDVESSSSTDDEKTASTSSQTPEETTTEGKKGELQVFMRELNGPRPCAGDRPNWSEVESYNGHRRGFPKDVVQRAEPAVLTGPCSGTLIGPDIAITAAQCEIRAGNTQFHLRVQLGTSGEELIPIDTEITQVIERSYSLVSGFEYAIIRLSGKPGDRWGWTKMAAVEITKDEPLGMVHAPASTSEKFGSGDFLHHGQGGFAMTQSLHSGKASVGAGVFDRSGFLVGVHAAGNCCESGIQGCDPGKEVGWHSSIFAAWKNSARLQKLVSAWQVGGPGVQFAATGTGKLYGLVPNKSGIWQYDSPNEWSKISGPSTGVFAGKSKVYRRTETKLYRYQGNSRWAPIQGKLDPKDEFAMDLEGDDIFRLPADHSQVQRLERGRWRKIGGPAEKLFPAPNGLIARHPDTKGIYRWLPSEDDWTKVSGPTDQIVETPDGVFFRRDDQGVYMKGKDTEWEKIGGEAEDLIIGGDGQLYAIHSKGHRIWQFDAKKKSWSLFGRPSRYMLAKGNRFFGIEKTTGHIVEYRMP